MKSNNYYTPIGGIGLAAPHLRPLATVDDPGQRLQPVVRAIWSVLSIAGAGMSAFHGYRRNRGSIGWTIGWTIFGGALPVLAVPISLAQGYGKPKVARNRRRRAPARRRTSRRAR